MPTEGQGALLRKTLLLRLHQVFTQFTLAEIRLLDLGSHFIAHDPFGEINKGSISHEILASFKDEKIPTLEEALIFTKEKHWKVNLELKSLPEDFKDFPITQRVIELIRTLEIDPGQLIISSYNHTWLRQVETMEPFIEIQALIGYSESEPLDWGDFSFSTYNARCTLIDEEQIARAKNKRKKINLFTVNEKDEMIRFINTGVNGLITDYPQRLATIVRKR